jgi:general secretion pathway protein J
MGPTGELSFRQNTGFTLIELLAALVLLGLIFLLLTSGLQFGTNVWSGREKEASGTAEVLTAQNFLRRVLSEARPVMIEADVSHVRHVFFIGDGTSIRFVTSMPSHLGIGGFNEVLLYQPESENSNRVEIAWRVFRSTDTAFVPTEEDRHAVLVTGVKQLEFAYYGRSKDAPAQWYSEWRDLDHLPDLIRMRVTFNDDEHVWPDLVVALPIRSLTPIIDPEQLMQ